ncbi:centrosomal protein of 63 kDa-like [Ciona intestinalis]
MDRSIWDCLEKQSEGGMLLTSCGAELQELMRQIDIMVRNKKMEWESELVASQDCLAIREQELSHARSLLDQKHQEVGVLKHQLESYESGQKNVASQYEVQLDNLKGQLKNLKESHEKMIRHRSKKNQSSAEKEKELTLEVERMNAELKEKRSVIVEHEKQTSEWDIRKRALQHQIECLEKQKRSIAVNYERVQQQLSVSQTRLKKSNRMVEEVERTSQSLLRKLEEELSNDKELIQQQERLIGELQSKTRELNSARHTATGEKYRYQEDADKANCRLRVLEEEVTKLQSALSARESALRGSEHEIAELKNKNLELITSIHTKDKLVEAMQVRSPVKRKEDELQQTVLLLEASMETMRETEKHLREEVKVLESRLIDARDETASLNDVLRKNDCAKVNSINEEIRILQLKLEEMEQSHSAQLCGMKAEVTNLTTHLHGRDANITRLSEHCSEMERQLKEESRRRDKLDCELQTAAKHLEHLREQRRRSSLSENNRDTPDKSLSEAEGQLSDLRLNYGKAVSRLEEENKQLKGQVDGLRHQLCNKDIVGNEHQSSHSQQTRDVINEMKSREEMRVNEVCRAYEHRIASLESKIREMESFPDPPASNSVVLRSDDADSGTMTPSSSNSGSNKDVRTPTPTKNFLLSIGIDPSSVNSSLVSSTMASMGEKQLHALLGISDEGFEDTGVSTVEEFTAEDEKRVAELESRIEKHIGDMTKAMDAAMEKYFK